MNDYYVYLHLRKDNNTVFYVGEGRLNRCNVTNKRSTIWKKVVDEAGGFIVKIIHSGLEKNEAVSKENEILQNPDASWKLINIAPIRKVKEIDLNEIAKVLEYDESSPSSLKWLCHKQGNYKKNKVAGYLSEKGYWQVRVNKKLYAAHRIVWLLNNGSIDDKLVINHIDNNPSNNKISNLELVTQSINSRRSCHNKVASNTGVNYIKMKTGYEYWIGYYHDLNSKRHSKSFSVSTYGFDKAKEMATQWRITNLQKLNKLGAGYNV